MGTFGRTDTSGATLTFGIDNRICGLNCPMNNERGRLTQIVAWIRKTTETGRCSCALYDGSGNMPLLAIAETKTIDPAGAPAWVTFNFNDPTALEPNKTYMLTLAGEDKGGAVILYNNNFTSTFSTQYTSANWTAGWVTPLGTITTGLADIVIYGVYESATNEFKTTNITGEDKTECLGDINIMDTEFMQRDLRQILRDFE